MLYNEYENEVKRMIFYQPLAKKIKLKNSGTNIRPQKMKEAFNKIGFEVINIDGDFSNRISQTKKYIEGNFNIKFIYCESSNIPFALSGKKHFPLRPFVDLENIKKFRKISKVGFFYRDIFWMESEYIKQYKIKGVILYILFYIEYMFLIRYVDILFIPSIEMKESFPFWKKFNKKYLQLSPGCNLPLYDMFIKRMNEVNILYSGNTDKNSFYNITNLIDICTTIEGIHLTINSENGILEYKRMEYDSNKIKFTSNNYNEANKLEEQFTIGIVWQHGKIKDLKKYMPIKLYYYMQLGIPVIGLKNTAYGKFIEENKIGWTYENQYELKNLLKELINKEKEIEEFRQNVLKIRKYNTWISRAKEVSNILGIK